MGKKYWEKMGLSPPTKQNINVEGERSEKKERKHINVPMKSGNLRQRCFGRGAHTIGHLFLLLLPLILLCYIYCFLLVSVQRDVGCILSANSATCRSFTCLHC